MHSYFFYHPQVVSIAGTDRKTTIHHLSKSGFSHDMWTPVHLYIGTTILFALLYVIRSVERGDPYCFNFYNVMTVKDLQGAIQVKSFPVFFCRKMIKLWSLKGVSDVCVSSKFKLFLFLEVIDFTLRCLQYWYHKFPQ